MGAQHHSPLSHRTPASPRLVRKSEVRSLSGLSNSTLDRLELAGSFPKRVRLGPNSVAWVLAEVIAWIEARAAERGNCS